MIGTLTVASEIKGLSLSVDGQKVAVAGSDGKVRILGTDGKSQETFAHEGAVRDVAYLPDGKRLLSASADKTARLWTPAFLGQGNLTGPVRQVILTPQGDRAFSVGDDRFLRIWEPKTGKELKAIEAHGASITKLALSADLTKAMTASADKSVKVWNLAEGKATATISLPAAQAIAFSPSGARAVIAYIDGATRVKTFDAVTGTELQTVAEPAGVINYLAFLADNRTLLVGGEGKSIGVYDTPVQSSRLIHPGGVTGFVYSPNGLQALTGGKDKVVHLLDLVSGKEVKAYGALADPVAALAASRDFVLVAAAAGKLAKVWQAADGKEIASLIHPAEVLALAFNADKTRLVTGAADNVARVWDLASGRVLQTFQLPGAVRGVAFHPTQPVVFTASADKSVQGHQQAIIRATSASASPLRAVAVTANGSHAITAGDDKLVKAWNAANGVNDRTFAGAEARSMQWLFRKTCNFSLRPGRTKPFAFTPSTMRNLSAPFRRPGLSEGSPSIPRCRCFPSRATTKR